VFRDRLGWDHKKSFFSWQQIVCTISSRKTYRRIDFIYINYFYHFSVTYIHISHHIIVYSLLRHYLFPTPWTEELWTYSFTQQSPCPSQSVAVAYVVLSPCILQCVSPRWPSFAIHGHLICFAYIHIQRLITYVLYINHPAYPLCSLSKYINVIVIYMSSTFINILCPCLGMECAVNSSSSPQSDTIPLQMINIYERL
jgi:hypothetical protein